MFFLFMFISPLVGSSLFLLIEWVRKRSFRQARVFSSAAIILFFGHLFAILGLFLFFRFSLSQILNLLKSMPFWFFLYYSLTSFFASIFLVGYYFFEEKMNSHFQLKYFPSSRTFYRTGWLALISLFLYVGINWYHANIPQGEPLSLFFAIVLPKEGIDNSLVLKGFMEIPLQLFILTIALLILFSPFWHVLYLKQSKWLLNLLSIFLFIASILNLVFLMKPLHYIKQAGAGLSKPISSEFFQKNFVDTEKVALKFPDKKRNLIWIFMESMESSAQSYEEGGLFEKNQIPKLTQLGKKHLNFSHHNGVGGGYDVVGTSWTAAGIAAKFSGVPLILPINENPAKTRRFLPGAFTLTDILAKEKYQQLFIFGSKKSFACRDLFLESHGNVEIHDIDWYKNKKMLDKDYFIFWGMEDLKLYRFARQELQTLSQKEAPFFFGMLTVDTHFPEGFHCDLCPPIESFDSEKITPRESYQSVLFCADTQLGNFLDWCATQSWYEETTIVITGDHLFMSSQKGGIYPTLIENKQTQQTRRWINIIINSQKEASEENRSYRRFSAMDMFPTVLEALGVDVPDSALGLGRSLFSGKPTLSEELGEEKLNQELSIRSFEYDRLIFGNNDSQ